MIRCDNVPSFTESGNYLTSFEVVNPLNGPIHLVRLHLLTWMTKGDQNSSPKGSSIHLSSLTWFPF